MKKYVSLKMDFSGILSDSFISLGKGIIKIVGCQSETLKLVKTIKLEGDHQRDWLSKLREIEDKSLIGKINGTARRYLVYRAEDGYETIYPESTSFQKMADWVDTNLRYYPCDGKIDIYQNDLLERRNYFLEVATYDSSSPHHILVEHIIADFTFLRKID